MSNPRCDEVLPYSPTETEAIDLYSWYIANCVLDALLIITATIFNGITIQALRKTSLLPKPLKTLLLNLVFSDLGVGLFVEPLYFVLLVNWAQQNNLAGGTCTAFLFMSYLFSLASFFGVLALTVDRFLAIHLHLRYQELVSHKRVIAVVISIWVFSSLLSLFRWRGSRNAAFIFFAIIAVFCFFLSAVLYCKIYLAVRHHRKQIQKTLQVQQVDQSGEITNFAKVQKSTLGTFYVYIVFLFCYLPNGCTFFFATISGLSTSVKAFSICATTLVYLNSSLNPVIYCWKMRHIRLAVMDIMRKFFLVTADNLSEKRLSVRFRKL